LFKFSAGFADMKTSIYPFGNGIFAALYSRILIFRADPEALMNSIFEA
jgi:hypothetical protein